jgi:hypothetical protein
MKTPERTLTAELNTETFNWLATLAATQAKSIEDVAFEMLEQAMPDE